MERIPMTSQGHQALQDELKKRITVERPRIIQAIAEARAHGDLSENAEYHAAKEAQGFNEARINEIEDKLGRADVIDLTKLSGDLVTFGATVDIMDEETEEKKRYQIVGEIETDASKGRISTNSPIARALIGKKKGDIVEVKTPAGVKEFSVLGVSFI